MFGRLIHHSEGHKKYSRLSNEFDNHHDSGQMRILDGGIAKPLKNMSSSVRMIVSNIWAISKILLRQNGISTFLAVAHMAK